MRSEPRNDTLLVRYLLGELTEEEQNRLEDRAFADADYLVALESAEAELIDAYVRGDLSGLRRRTFETRFLNADSRRRKVEFARALAQVAHEFKAPGAWQTLINNVRAWNLSLQLSAGLAALIMVAGVAWLGVESASMRSRIVALEAERRDLRQEMAGQSRAPASAARALATLILGNALTRSETRRDRVVLVPTIDLVRIEIPLDERDEYPGYRVELRTREGEAITMHIHLGQEPKLSFEVAASALPSGDYELALKGISGTETTDIGYYYFSVERP